MSEGMQEKLQRQREAAKNAPRKTAAEAFHRPADDMAKFTTYLPKTLIERMKLRAVQEKSSAAKMITEEMERRLSEPVRKPDQPRRRGST